MTLASSHVEGTNDEMPPPSEPRPKKKAKRARKSAADKPNTIRPVEPVPEPSPGVWTAGDPRVHAQGKALVELIEEQRRLLAWAAVNVEDYSGGEVHEYAGNALRSQLLRSIGMTMEMEARAQSLIDGTAPRKAVGA